MGISITKGSLDSQSRCISVSLTAAQPASRADASKSHGERQCRWRTAQTQRVR